MLILVVVMEIFVHVLIDAIKMFVHVLIVVLELFVHVLIVAIDAQYSKSLIQHRIFGLESWDVISKLKAGK